jgi:hypothetical protein
MQTLNGNQADRDEMVTKRRRAIYFGLCDMLPPEVALKGVKIWQSEFSDKPVYALQPFITRLGSEFDFDTPRNVIQRTLINALNVDISELPPDPLKNEDIDRPYLVATGETARVFSQLITNAIRMADSQDTTATLNIKNAFSKGVRKLGIRSQHHDQLLSIFLAPAKEALIEDLTFSQIQDIVHLLYVQMCEYLGPITADRIMSEAVRLTEALPESATCPPRSFL